MLGARCPSGSSACTLSRCVPGSRSGRRVEMMPWPCSLRRAKGLSGSCSSSLKMGRWRREVAGVRCTTSRRAAMPRGRGSTWYCSVGGPAGLQNGGQRPTHSLHERWGMGGWWVPESRQDPRGRGEMSRAGWALPAPQHDSPWAGASPVPSWARHIHAPGTSPGVEAHLARATLHCALHTLIHICRESRDRSEGAGRR